MASSKVDLIVVGAGPTGLMTALTAASCGLKRIRIFEKRPKRITAGNADGLFYRTIEIMDSFGLAEKFLEGKNSAPFTEFNFWGTNESGSLEFRGKKMPDLVKPYNCQFTACGISQAFLEGVMIDKLRDEYQIEVERAVTVGDLDLDVKDENGNASVKISISRGEDHDNQEKETVEARFLVGSDGVRSWTREQLKIEMTESLVGNDFYGAMDIIPISDFPDIRTMVRLMRGESWLAIIPRERDYIRVYVRLGANNEFDKAKMATYTPDVFLEAAGKALDPYRLSFKHLEWHSVVHDITDRMASVWSDPTHRVFLAGDACHTHDPSLGQGMNTSTCDGYNIGWKIALVVKGVATPSILSTYETERRPIPEQLINFDTLTDKYGRGLPDEAVAAKAGLTLSQLRELYPPREILTSGLGIQYGPNVLIPADVGDQSAAKKITLGARMPYHEIVNHASARVENLSTVYKADGRFRIMVFPGRLDEPQNIEQFRMLCHELYTIVFKYTPEFKGKPKSLFDTITVHSTNSRRSVEFPNSFPDILLEYDNEMGWNYNKIFVDEGGQMGSYEAFGIDEAVGAVVVVRPDGYVGYIGSLALAEDLVVEIDSVVEKDVTGPLTKYFEGFMIPQRTMDEPYRIPMLQPGKKAGEKIWTMPWE